jgi:hypothetical protein
MYIPEKIKALSNAQINKMLNGLPVRVQKGLDHVINLSLEQSKKFNKSAIKGKGVTIRLDPFQVIQHRNLKGQGFGSLLKSASSMAKTAAKKAGKQLAQKGLTMAQAYAQDAINQHLSGEGFGDYLKTAGRFAKSTAKSAGKRLAKEGLNLAHKAVSDAVPGAMTSLGSVIGHPELGALVSPYVDMGIDKGFSVAKQKSGLGIKRKPGRPKGSGKTKTKSTKPKTKKRKGKGMLAGALRPAGF